MTVLGEQGGQGEETKPGEEGWEEEEQAREEPGVFRKYGRVLVGGEGVSRLPSTPQGHFAAFSLAPPSTSVCLGQEARLPRAPGLLELSQHMQRLSGSGGRLWRPGSPFWPPCDLWTDLGPPSFNYSVNCFKYLLCVHCQDHEEDTVPDLRILDFSEPEGGHPVGTSSWDIMQMGKLRLGGHALHCG